MEYLTTVHGGSTGELHAGYWLCAITGAEVRGCDILPIHQNRIHRSQRFTGESWL